MTTSTANVQGAPEALPVYKHHLKCWTTLSNCDSLTIVYKPEACAGTTDWTKIMVHRATLCTKFIMCL